VRVRGCHNITSLSSAKKGLAFRSKKSVCVHTFPGVAESRTGAPLAPTIQPIRGSRQ
jgi:hypothetical protein